MLRFYREYPDLPKPLTNLVPQVAAQLLNLPRSTISAQLAFGIPWFHHVILIEKVKDLPTRF
jgi:hypothetical protein